MADPLRMLLDLPVEEKVERGLEHTPRETWQQPDTWKKTYQLCEEKKAELNDVLRRAGDRPREYVVAHRISGWRGHFRITRAGHWLSIVPPTLELRGLAHSQHPTLLTEFEEFHRPGKEYLWISFSRSGESPEGVALLEQALDRHREIRHLVITCNPLGPMAQICSRHPDRALALVLDEAVNDRGLAMTSSFSNMVLAGQCLGHLEDLAQFGEVIEGMSTAGRKFLPSAAEAAAAITLLGCTRACFVGAGVLRAVADESALKVVELCAGKVTTLAETPLGLRHGPLSSVDGQTLFVAFLSSDSRRRGYELDLLREIDRKHLGRVRAVVTTRPGDGVASLVDYCLPLDCGANFPDQYRPALDVMLSQLIGLFASMRSWWGWKAGSAGVRAEQRLREW